jgi:hypothetical protein
VVAGGAAGIGFGSRASRRPGATVHSVRIPPVDIRSR